MTATIIDFKTGKLLRPFYAGFNVVDSSFERATAAASEANLAITSIPLDGFSESAMKR